ncbi:hypothetical protein EDB83DRAFT_2312849 [Lactarius deliciosus]|nr:hypothetical protein EDB83DRAFT_2312849 [Lactarius deliciosus]
MHVQVDKKWADKNCKKRWESWGYLGITARCSAFNITSATVSLPPPSTSLPGRQVGVSVVAAGWSYTQAGVMIKKLILMHWAEAQLVVSHMFVVIVVVGLVLPVLVSSMSIVVAIVLAAIILVVAAVSGRGGDLYATLVLRVATAWRRGQQGFRVAGWRWWACM